MGMLIGDALGMPTQWYYDLEAKEKDVPWQDGEEVTPPRPTPYTTTPNLWWCSETYGWLHQVRMQLSQWSPGVICV